MSIKNIHQRPIHAKIIIIKPVNADNHENNSSLHNKPSSEAWICLMDIDRPQIIIIHNYRSKLILDPAVDLVKLGWPGQEWSNNDPSAKLWYCKVQNGYACSIIYVNSKTQVQIDYVGEYKHNTYI